MRSEIAKKILSETPQEVKEKVREHGNEIVKQRQEEVMEVARNLSPQEIQEAIYAFASAKYHRLKQGNDEDFKARKESLKKV